MSTETLDRAAAAEFAPSGLDGIPITRQRFRLDRRLGLAVLGLFAAVGIAWYGWNWWEVGRFIETTDDAYVGGNVTTISPHVAGFVSKILVGDNQFVEAGQLVIELDDRGGMPAGELAAAARLAPGTVTQMLDHLADCGHVERVRSETDRRIVLTRLTPQGRRKTKAKREAWRSRWEEALVGVAEEDLRAAARVLERLGTMLEDTPPSGPAEAPNGAGKTSPKAHRI